MALPNSSLLSFVLGALVLLYLSTFVVFAVLRVLTGVSIQRLWGLGLRHVSFSPREGLRIDIRGLGFSLHRPTFSQPTWISIVVSELKVTVDLRLLGSKKVKRSAWERWTNGGIISPPASPGPPVTPVMDADSDTEDREDTSDSEDGQSRTWERLTQIKERIKRLHRSISYLRMVDVVATNSSLVIVDVGFFQVSNFTMGVDTRKKTIDRGRLFQHRKTSEEDNRRPAEWIMTGRSLLFSTDGVDFNELLDHATLNIHGMLSQKQEGLRDASIALKLGRLSLPVDDLQLCLDRIHNCRKSHSRHSSRASQMDASLLDLLDAPDSPGSPKDQFSKAVADSKGFVASILRGIQEIQFAISYVGLSKRIDPIKLKGAPAYLNMSMKEVGVDLLRLDSRSPAHLTYFSPSDVAHQALVTAISISVGIDDGHDHPERLLYIPLATATLKTTLPSKAIQLSTEKNLAQRNSNILFANLVITSPSVDLDPKHLPLTLALLDRWRDRSSSLPRGNNHRLIFKLLPKANIKVSIHEPVFRVSLPAMDVERRGTGEYDLLISAMSSMSLDIESSHAPTGDTHYSLNSSYRVTTHQLYYQTASGDKHNLLMTDTFEIKLQVNAAPNVAVAASVNAQTFNLYMIRPEISEGVRQIIIQLHRDAHKRRRPAAEGPKMSFLRRLPTWLHHVHISGADFNLEVAGVDASVSDQAKGASIHLESWTAEYKVDRTDESSSRPARRRTTSRSFQNDDLFLRPTSSHSSRKLISNSTDGRRLAIHTYGLEAFVIEAADTWESEPFLSLPRFETAITTLTDQQGPVQNIHSFARHVYCHYSLYRHFAIGLASSVLRKTFSVPRAEQLASDQSHMRSKSEDLRPLSPGTLARTEITTVDFKSSLIQIKAATPSDPNLMIQLFAVEAGQHRWGSPFAKIQLARLYAEAPHVKKAWSRIVSSRNLQFTYRSSKRKQGSSVTEERSVDIVTDAIRVAVPHQLVVHKIFDNITNIVKTVEQLHHRVRTGTSEYVLKKGPQGPKRVPKVSFRASTLLFEIEDSAFEWKLGLIYVQGLHEQKQRLARREAFELKKKKILEMEAVMSARQDTQESKERRGWHIRGRYKRRSSDDVTTTQKRSKSAGDETPQLSHSPTRPTSRRLRYDAEGVSSLSEHALRSIKDSEAALDRFNASSWKKRINKAYQFQQHRMRDIHSMAWGQDEIPDNIEQKEKITATPLRPALFGCMVRDFNITIDKPSFALNDYPNFLHKVGKGLPRDMQYSLLIPMHVTITMGDARGTLRDYPIPLIHIPPIKSGQSARLSALSLSTDFVIAEEYRDEESIRHAKIVVVPPNLGPDGDRTKGLIVDVRRTVGSTKTYSDISAEINTASPTRITWGASYQPAIQDMMQVVESFMKPAVDPSQRVGFWDKIRLAFHSRINVAWKGQGDVHLILKGSRDPYSVTGVGAGFVMCWRNDVRWSIRETDDPKKFMTVNSGEYVLAIPDFGHFARRALEGDVVDNTNVANTSPENAGKFKKTVMKLSGKVQWLAGIVFERNIDGGGRSFEFRPHYDIVLKNPKYAKPSKSGEQYDAFRGFRSHHIHLSIAVAAPVDRDWTVTNLKPSSNYNSVHLTPRFFSHFFNWWSMFSGNMSLPIRQGKLWPGVDKTSKKFGRHLATIKYNLLLSPLYLSHIYKYKGPDQEGQECIFAAGLKVKLDSFMLDLHQRREIFRKFMQGNRQVQTSGIRINKAQLDFISADFRAVSATMREPTQADLDEASDETLATLSDHIPKANLANFTIPDRDTGWVDMDDFVELDWILPMGSTPETVILPLAFSPRFTYFRQTDHQDVISGDPTRSSPFGNEDTHYCVMSARNDPRRVQCDLIQGRLDRIAEQLSHHKRNIGEHELNVIRDRESQPQLKLRLDAMQKNHDMLVRKEAFLKAMHKNWIRQLEDADDRSDGPAPEDEFFEAHEDGSGFEDVEGMANDPLAEDISDFSNRFIVHNAQLKWSNPLRDIMLRYIHQISQRRGFVYYMSRPAVKFIIDIVEEQNKARESSSRQQSERRPGSTEPVTPLTPMPPDLPSDRDEEAQGMIQQLLEDGKRFVEADDNPEDETPKSPGHGGPGDEISREFLAQNSYHVRLIAPQIQMQSEKNTKSAVLVTAKGMQLRVVQIMDKDRITDEVSGLVQRRFTANMDSVQVFVTSSKTFSSELLELYSGNRYGAPSGTSWPPWVPLEDMYDFHVDPYGFSRVVQRTSASMQYNKYNTLRLKYNDDLTNGQENTEGDENESRMDHIWVDFPQLLTKCNSTQYYALYVIVMDLLLYSEPQEKTREEKLEKIILASDFSDLSEAPDMVTKLQEKIRTLQEIKLMFQLHESLLTRQQWKERILLEDDIAKREDELFFIMKAITTSQRQIEDRMQTGQPTGTLKYEIAAKELVWHMVRGLNESLIELQLKDVQYLRTDNTDGSNDNTMELGKIEGWTLLSNANYPQLIAPFEEGTKKGVGQGDSGPSPMVRVHWYMLEAVAGIVVMEKFEVSIFPIRIQLEYDTGMKVLEYIFPGSLSSGKDAEITPFLKHLLPTHQEEDENESKEQEDHDPAPDIIPDHHLITPTDNLTGAGDLELRLQPTLTLPDSRSPKSPRKMKQSTASNSDLKRLKNLGHAEGTDLRKLLARKKDGASTDQFPGPKAMSRTNSQMSEMTKATETPKRFGLLRSTSTASNIAGNKKQQQQRSNDVSEMMDRASKYMTLSYVNVSSMVLCLSYKGKGERNIVTANVHDLVFRLPTLEYRNKTWSTFDLVNHLRKEVVQALLRHSPTILGNMFTHHRPNRNQQSRLREMANSSVILGNGLNDSAAALSIRDPSKHFSDVSSSRAMSTTDYDISFNDDESGYHSRDPSLPRGSFASNRESQYSRDEAGHSATSSAPSSSFRNSHHLSMTPANGNGNGHGADIPVPSIEAADRDQLLKSRPRTASGAMARLSGAFPARRPSTAHSESTTPFVTPAGSPAPAVQPSSASGKDVGRGMSFRDRVRRRSRRTTPEPQDSPGSSLAASREIEEGGEEEVKSERKSKIPLARFLPHRREK
ncbi:hypothetical protein BT63DRAFT_478518 [Microthyrium microscopicum]|uniref:Mitochondrial protein from FMP27-domain-containing protein n=1 Tax=Microthyrium microscopicum TaxID=703497 RepID=A0A6A6UDH6_9PEZI|nr:hypothetical protein BT63DRAFT_478518 [Microthyrium microscopicum]